MSRTTRQCISPGAQVARLLLCIVLACSMAIVAWPRAGHAQGDLTNLSPERSWPVIDLPEASTETHHLMLRKLSRIECGDHSEIVIGEVVGVSAAASGHVLLVDSQLCQAVLAAENGDIEAVFGRCGEGPGELSGAYRAIQLSNGLIGIADGGPAPMIKFGARGNVELFDLHGAYASQLLAGGEPGAVPLCVIRDLRCNGGLVLASTYRGLVQPPRMNSVLELNLVDPSNGSREVVARTVHSLALGQPVRDEADAYEPYASGRCDISAGGMIAYAPERDEWRIAIRRADGTGVVLQRRWSPRMRSDAVKSAIRSELGASDAKVYGAEPAIGRVSWRPNGSLWVEPAGVPVPGDAFACFDEVSVAGAVNRRIYLHAEGARVGDEYFLLSDGRVAILEGFGGHDGGAATAPAVVLYDSAP